jgi:hypothetical protein
MPEFMCAYANCEKTDTPITVTLKSRQGTGMRDRFCCQLHAAAFLLKWGTNIENSTAKRIELSAARANLESIIGDGKNA